MHSEEAKTRAAHCDDSDSWCRFVSILRSLRGPDGCPWDKQQTYQTLTGFVLEESYEVVQAALEKDVNKLKEELGDLLLEIGLYATIAGELGDFTFKDVLDGISDKLIRRHPHVFGGRDAGSPEQVERLWAEIKRKEPGRYARGHSLMDEVDKGLPALMRAQKQQAVAARAGFDWPDVNGVFDKVQEEMSEIKEAYDKGNKTEVMDEVGDLLFACVNLARHLGVNAEVALLHTVEKFSRRFRQIESYLKSRSLRMEEMGLDVLGELWEKAKEAEAKEGE
ncbi:MAG TPA: nucleoside triphosphate pyrophosphohydrolase [Firmicutes bacterium]|nr:nucleoside triphosphate pyrophosphohydrolase [Bacillota bacterium]